MKYKVGDKVRIQSKEWYESHKNKFGKVWTVSLSGECTICFDQDNAKYCGKEVIIFSVEPDNYVLRGIPYEWTDEMIEGYAEGEPLDIPTMTTDFVKEHGLPCPEGYIFKDENGNIINTTKIVLEKKKKEYPNTYEECLKVLGYDDGETYCVLNTEEDEKLFERLYTLKVCRDAYWKIAGEEMGLGKPWKPDYDSGVNKFGIICLNGVVQESNPATNWERHLNKVFDFPTKEMRDAFYENFKSEIESCKELL